ncbi:hypothetical protein [Sphingobacterium sp. NPDC055431]
MARNAFLLNLALVRRKDLGKQKKYCFTGCIGEQVLYLRFPPSCLSDAGRISEYSKPIFI